MEGEKREKMSGMGIRWGNWKDTIADWTKQDSAGSGGEEWSEEKWCGERGGEYWELLREKRESKGRGDEWSEVKDRVENKSGVGERNREKVD